MIRNARWGAKRWRGSLWGVGASMWFNANQRAGVRWRVSLQLACWTWEFFNYRTYGN